MEKDGILYKGMARYRRKFFIINILLTILFVMYTMNKLPYLKTEWCGPSPLDTERFLSETETIVVDELVELTRKDHKTPDASYLKHTSYWQDDAYSFTLKADSVTKTDVVFKGKVTTVGTSDTEYKDMYELYIAEISGRKAAVLSFAGQEVNKNMTACIVHMQKPILSEISGMLKEDEAVEISEYVIDVRGLEMEAASSDHVFFWLYLAGILFLYIKLIRYYINPLSTPTYKQLQRYGKAETVAEEINRQATLPSARRNGRELILEEFILKKSYMKLAVVKNHMAKN